LNAEAGSPVWCVKNRVMMIRGGNFHSVYEGAKEQANQLREAMVNVLERGLQARAKQLSGS
jgi:hypothetical protein